MCVYTFTVDWENKNDFFNICEKALIYAQHACTICIRFMYIVHPVWTVPYEDPFLV